MRWLSFDQASLYSAIQTVAIWLWMQFLLGILPAEHLQLPLLSWPPDLRSAPIEQLRIRMPPRESDVRTVRIVAERGSLLVWTSEYSDPSESWQTLALPSISPGQVSIKAVGLDNAGCILYGGVVAVLVPHRSSGPPIIEIDMKKLDVPLCR